VNSSHIAELGVICTRSGLHFDVTKPDPNSILITDIAYGLSHKCRFGGHTSRWYSVAQHSIQVCEYVQMTGTEDSIALAALLHDASEAYLTDLPSPIKAILPAYITLEKSVQTAINEHFGLTRRAQEHEIIKRADIMQYEIERRHLMPDVSWWSNPHEPECQEPMPESYPDKDYNEFLAKYNSISHSRRVSDG
jgi:hypothetical protein